LIIIYSSEAGSFILLDVRLEAPNTNGVVGVTSEEGVAIGAPSQRDGFRFAFLGVSEEPGDAGVQFGDLMLALKIPNLDAIRSGGAQPVAIRGESQGMDDASSVEGVQLLVLNQVPQVGGLVATSRGAEGTVRRDSDGIEITLMTGQVFNQFAVSQTPHFDELVESARDNDRVSVAGREFDAAGPEGVVLLRDGELAFTQGVPQADGSVSGGRNDLTIVGGEGDAEDFFGVSHEATSSGSRLKVPQSEGVVPSSREGKESIRRDDNVLNKVGVTGQRFARITVISFFVCQIPNKKRPVS